MACYFKSKGLTLVDYMDSLYNEYGYYSNQQFSFYCEGASGVERMNEIMSDFRNNTPKQIAGKKVISTNDYLLSAVTDLDTGATEKILLPKSNVFIFNLEDNSSVTISPSGTEPKIKVYIEAVGNSLNEANATTDTLKKDISKLMGF